MRRRRFAIRVFYDEMKAVPDAEDGRRCAATSTPSMPCVSICSSLIRTGDPVPESIVATYRLLRGSSARAHGRFYTSGEYDIAALAEHPGEILELGRSCVDAAYRGRPTMQLLWGAIAQFVFHHDISLMFGCASLHGVDPEELAIPLSYLHHFHRAPEALRPTALPDLYVDMNFIPPRRDRPETRARASCRR